MFTQHVYMRAYLEIRATFFGTEILQNSDSAGALLRTLLGELMTLAQTP